LPGCRVFFAIFVCRTLLLLQTLRHPGIGGVPAIVLTLEGWPGRLEGAGDEQRLTVALQPLRLILAQETAVL
jgi:hypothetical protein